METIAGESPNNSLENNEQRATSANVPMTSSARERENQPSRAGRIGQDAAGRLHRAAAALRDRVSDDQNPKLTRFASGAATAIDQAATYVEGASLARFKEDAAGVVRRYPIQSLAVGMGLGFLAARMIRR